MTTDERANGAGDPRDAAGPEDPMEGFIERAARRAVGLGFETPAILFLEASKPMATFLEHAVYLGAAFLYPIFGAARTDRAAAFLRDRRNIERLIARIEALEEARRRQD